MCRLLPARHLTVVQIVTMARLWGGRALPGLLAVFLLASVARAARAPTVDEFEALSDRLADASIELAECRSELAKLNAKLAGLQAAAASGSPQAPRTTDGQVGGCRPACSAITAAPPPPSLPPPPVGR